jgi:hypothetical protein
VAPTRAKERGGVIFPHKTSERKSWIAALEATIDEWRCAFERDPSPLSEALAHAYAADTEDLSMPAANANQEGLPVLALVPPSLPRGIGVTMRVRARAEAAA